MIAGGGIEASLGARLPSPLGRRPVLEVAMRIWYFVPGLVTGLLLSAPAGAQAPDYLMQWGSYGTSDGQFANPFGIAAGADGRVYVADCGNDRIQVFTSGGVYVAQWGALWTVDVAVDASGTVYASGPYAAQLSRFTADGIPLLPGWSLPGGSYITGIGVDADGNVYLADAEQHRILKYAGSGELVTQWGSYGTGDGQFNCPWDVAVDPSGNVYVADINNRRIQRFTRDGTYVSQWAVPGCIVSVATDAEGNVYVSDVSYYRVQVYSGDGALVTQWGAEGTGDGQFGVPGGVAVDASGTVYVVDSDNHRVEVFGALATPVTTTSWGSVKTRYR
jgi:DNA-binding beta-propeller fold protein YncE